jgi:hypothetical protein
MSARGTTDEISPIAHDSLPGEPKSSQELSQEFGISGENQANRENDEKRKRLKTKEIRRWLELG